MYTDDRVEFVDREAVAIDEQVVELAAVALELGPSIEDFAEDVVDDTNVLADAERAAEPILDVGRSREVIDVDVYLENPLNLEPCSRMKAMTLSADLVAVRPEAAS